MLEEDSIFLKNFYLKEKRNDLRKDIYAAIDSFEKAEHIYKYLMFLDGLKSILVEADPIRERKWLELSYDIQRPVLTEFVTFFTYLIGPNKKYTIEEGERTINNYKKIDIKIGSEQLIELFKENKNIICTICSYFLKRQCELHNFECEAISIKQNKEKA